MKRTDFSGVLSCAAAILAVAILVVGCKPQGEKNDPGSKAADSCQQGAEALMAEDWTRAYDRFSDAIAADQKNVDAYYGRAAASGAMAEEHYRLAQAAATNQDQKTGEAEAKKADEFFKKSIDDCEKILEIDPDYADAYFLKGVAAQYQGAWQDGIDAFSECVKLDPKRAEAYHRRGEIYDNIGDYMNSSVDFKKASELGYADKKQSEDQDQNGDLEDFSDLNYDAEEVIEDEQTNSDAEEK